MSNEVSLFARRTWLRWGFSLQALVLAGPVAAAVTDIAQTPLVATSGTVVKPNLMFVLDDSGSMGFDYLPDEANYSLSRFGRRAYQCNGVAYNPSTKYTDARPLNSVGEVLDNASTAFLSNSPGDSLSNTRTITGRSPATLSTSVTGSISINITSGNPRGSSYPTGRVVTLYDSSNASRFIIASVTGWDSGTWILTLNVLYKVGSGTFTSPAIGDFIPDNVYMNYTGAQKKLSYTYDTNGLITTSTFYTECNSLLGDDPGKSVFTPVVVTAASPEAQNYANWKTYYSTRMAMMKTSISRAFKDIDDKYRVGYSTILKTDASEDNDFLDIRDFSAKQKESFYKDFNAAVPGGSTPLRGALAKAGQYYAKKVKDQTYDPIQYSCQKNFTILSTDGYWNTNDESATYGPKKLDGSTDVGQQDGGGTPTPMYDGGHSTVTTTETWTTTATWERTTVTPSTTTTTETTVKTDTKPLKGWNRTSYSLSNPNYSTRSNSTVTVCGSLSGGKCTISITTTSNHGYSNGATVTMSGITPAQLNGAFVITSTGSKSFTYQVTGLSSVPAAVTVKGVNGASTSGCAPGFGKQVQTVEKSDDLEVLTTTAVKTTTTTGTSTVVDRYTTTQSNTRTVVVVDGVQNSDTTAQGPVSSPTITRISGPTVASTSPVVTNGSDVKTTYPSTAWSTVSTTPQTSCVNTVSPTVTVEVAPFTPTTSVTASPVVVGPTKVNGTNVVTDTAATVTDSAKSSNTVTNSAGGSSSSLADVAMYYYQTDLRTVALGNDKGSLGTDVSTNNVSGIGLPSENWQRMSTYTISLGLSGTLAYDPNYETQGLPGDFAKIKNGSAGWPVPSDGGTAANIDDLWHAAVNGRGKYFSASDPNSLSASLSGMLGAIDVKLGAGSSAAVSSLEPVTGDNGIYIARFKSPIWTGDLQAYRVDPATGAINLTTEDWSAAARLTSATVRTIYHFRRGAGNTGSLQPFTYAALTSSGLNGYVDNACSKAPALSQCSGMSSADLAIANSGSNMVSYLRGQAQSVFRAREQLLGDIANSSPAYVGKPVANYSENGYASFKATASTRAGMIYVGANDGMLHAFDKDTGDEKWAYIPTMVMPNLYKLADKNYSTQHLYFVDGSPKVSDIYVPSLSAWRTILVGGLNAGGRGYYALDVTDPLNPKALWEYTDDDLGYTFGNPVITKRKDGTWVVAFGSGHNNVSPGDGGGYLYVLDAYSGARLLKIPTEAGSGNVGTPTTPSGLSKIQPWVESSLDNTAKRFYGGDLLGNVWRFDIDGLLEPKNKALLLATLTQDNKPQPITTKFQLAEVKSGGVSYPVVYVGTGRYLGTSDPGVVDKQSVYAIKDSLGATGLDAAGMANMVVQTLDASTHQATSNNPVDWATKNGWRVDLPTSGERVNIDPLMALDTLVVPGNVPGAASNPCNAPGGGKSWLYYFNIATGTSSSVYMGEALVVGLTGQLVGHDKSGKLDVIMSDGTACLDTTKCGIPPIATTGASARRTSWRELID